MGSPTELQRSLSLPLLTCYGIGAILGAGIYVLVGEVAGRAGYTTPLAFFLAAVIAASTALSYAELSRKFPRSAGAALYVAEGFNSRYLTILIGLMVVATGLVSCATLMRGLVGYVQAFAQLPAILIVVTATAAVTGIACWGIRESGWIIAIITLVEIAGLLFVIGVGSDALLTLPDLADQLIPPPSADAWLPLGMGTFLAFYAYIGFEDMANVAEEVVDPTRNLPLGILLAIFVSTTLYILVALVAITALPMDILANNKAPMMEIVLQQGYSPVLITFISLIAIVNGAIVQIIMASRVLYGMAQLGTMPAWFGVLSAKRFTPINATLSVGVLVLILATLLPLATLAASTSFIILVVFVFVNASLIRIRSNNPSYDYRYWASLPWLAMVLSAMLIGVQMLQWLYLGNVLQR